MIVIDTSALVSMIGEESDADALRRRASLANGVLLSTGTGVEVAVVVGSRWGEAGARRLETLLAELSIEFRPVEEMHMRIAIDAYGRFGRGSGHPAKLNYGDCFSYALARSLDAPLLFKGDDFTHTDIRSAL